MQNAPRGFSHGIPHDNEMLVKQDMVTSEDGITHKRCCIFSNILSFLIDHVLFFTDHEQVFLGKYRHIIHI